MGALLQVTALNIRYPKRQAVWGISFSVGRGELVAVVGESGSGKSSLALAIGRLLPPEAEVSGSIQFQGVQLLELPASDLRVYRGRRIAYVFQDPTLALNPDMKCGEQVAEVIRLHQGLAPTKVEASVLAWFDRVKLDDPKRIAVSYPHQISGGQRQRVMIAMALAGQPELLIADEPTASLDPELRTEILALLRSLQQELSMSLLLISHDLWAVQHLADRVLVLRDGQLLDNVPIAGLMQPYTRALLACRPDPRQPLSRLRTLDDVIAGYVPPNRSPRVLSEPQPLLLEAISMNIRYRKSDFWGKNTIVEVVKQGAMQIFRGEIVGLIGPSGIGKSSVAREILRLSGGAREGAVFISQQPAAALNPRMTVVETIAEPLRVHKIAISYHESLHQVRELLDQVGLSFDEIGTRKTGELSGGQQQRVCIARALAVQPRLLICDEVVASLDVSIQAQIINLLADLRESRQLSILFISHDWAVVQHLCDRILTIEGGKVVEVDA
jgi:peptide/nickel transport system ATP-binding protein